MLVFSAADFEDFLEPRPDLAPGMEDELERVVRHLVEHRWPFRLHATYNESISRMLDVFEKLTAIFRLTACTGSSTMRRLSPGQHRPHQSARRRHCRAAPYGLPGEYFAERYGIEATRHTPPVAKCWRPAYRWA